MRYAKLFNDFPIYAPNPIVVAGVRIGNPPGEVYEAEGYKPVVYTNHGKAPAGYEWREIWSEEEGNIQQGWVLEEVPITEDEALTQYSNKLTGAADESLPEATETLIKHVKGETKCSSITSLRSKTGLTASTTFSLSRAGTVLQPG